MHKGSQCLDGFRRAQALAEQRALLFDYPAQLLAIRCAHQAFAVHHCSRCQLLEAQGHFAGLGQGCRAAIQRLIGDAPGCSLLTGKALPEQQQFGSAGVAEQTRQNQAGTVFRAQAKVDEGHLQRGLAADIDQVAMQQHRRADTHRRTVDGGHHWFAELEQRLHKLEHFAVQPRRGLLDKVGDIVATGKAALAASDQHGAHAFILIGLHQHFGHAAVHSAGQGIFLVGAVHA